MRKCMDVEALHVRLNKVVGQLNAIQRMIDEDVPCEQVLIQLNAAKGAIHRIGVIVLEGHLNHCVREGIESGKADETLSQFSDALEHFTRMA